MHVQGVAVFTYFKVFVGLFVALFVFWGLLNFLFGVVVDDVVLFEFLEDSSFAFSDSVDDIAEDCAFVQGVDSGVEVEVFWSVSPSWLRG